MDGVGGLLVHVADHRTRVGRATCLSLVLALGALVCSAVVGPPANAAAGGPSISPVTGGRGAPVVLTTSFDLAAVGYQQSEFFVSGTANAYAPAQGTTLAADGKWRVVPSSTAPYTTRVVAYRPADPKRFNGTVLVEWLNVSGGLDVGVDWALAHNELVRQGYAYVGVSAQAVGLNATKAGDPARYGPLSHPGDSYSYDMFSQAGRAVRAHGDLLLDGLVPKHVIAAGESQSAIRMVTYIDGVHPLAKVFDGFFVHSRFSAAPLSQSPLPDIVPQAPTRVRTDLDVPVLVLQTESDVLATLTARQPDTPRYRLWEVAGTAHADNYTLGVGFGDTGDGQAAITMFNLMLHPTAKPIGDLFDCASPINAGPHHWVVQAAIHHLERWVRTGTPPPTAPRLQTAGSPPSYVVDGNGNARGGVRTPHVDTPVAALRGVGQAGNGFCSLFGTTTPFRADRLAALYPSHGAFVARWSQALDRAVAAGFLRSADAPELRAAAAKSEVGRVLVTTLLGDREIGTDGQRGAGDPNGSGTARIALRGDDVCFDLSVGGVGLPAVGAHIHDGRAGENGPIVVSLTAPPAGGRSRGCVPVDARLRAALVADPGGFYVNVHTSAFPSGALRGNLLSAGKEHTLATTTLSGRREIGTDGRPGAGDPNGLGAASVTFQGASRVCFTIAVRQVARPAIAAHIHHGRPGENGPIVVTLGAPDGQGRSSSCVGHVAPALAADIAAHPGDYYVNVHTSEFPNGAVRGNLRGAPEPPPGG